MIKNNISVSNAEVTEAINFYKSEIVKQLSKDLNSDKGQAVFAILFNGYCPVNEIALFLIKRVNGSKKRLLNSKFINFRTVLKNEGNKDIKMNLFTEILKLCIEINKIYCEKNCKVTRDDILNAGGVK